jgi:hypothetical protein
MISAGTCHIKNLEPAIVSVRRFDQNILKTVQTQQTGTGTSDQHSSGIQ